MSIYFFHKIFWSFWTSRGYNLWWKLISQNKNQVIDIQIEPQPLGSIISYPDLRPQFKGFKWAWISLYSLETQYLGSIISSPDFWESKALIISLIRSYALLNNTFDSIKLIEVFILPLSPRAEERNKGLF